MRSVFKHVNSGGSFGARSLCQEIGVADADRIARLEVFWPTSGRRDVFEDLPVDHRYTVVEGSEVLGRLALAPPGASSVVLEGDD